MTEWLAVVAAFAAVLVAYYLAKAQHGRQVMETLLDRYAELFGALDLMSKANAAGEFIYLGRRGVGILDRNRQVNDEIEAARNRVLVCRRAVDLRETDSPMRREVELLVRRHVQPNDEDRVAFQEGLDTDTERERVAALVRDRAARHRRSWLRRHH
jgi:hypothetical protein